MEQLQWFFTLYLIPSFVLRDILNNGWEGNVFYLNQRHRGTFKINRYFNEVFELILRSKSYKYKYFPLEHLCFTQTRKMEKIIDYIEIINIFKMMWRSYLFISFKLTERQVTA